MKKSLKGKTLSALTVMLASVFSANASQNTDQEKLFQRIENAQNRLEVLESDARPIQSDKYKVQQHAQWYNWGNWNNWNNWPNYWNNWINY